MLGGQPAVAIDNPLRSTAVSRLKGGSNITVAAVITRWFTSRRGLAIGLSLSGMAVGQLAVVPLSLFLITRYGWRYTIAGIGV